MRSTPAGRVGVKLAVAFTGGALVAVGIVLLPLPGPGWLVILAGLAILALEFVWARRALHFTRARLRRWATLVREGSWPVRLASAVGTLLVLSLAVWVGWQVVHR